MAGEQMTSGKVPAESDEQAVDVERPGIPHAHTVQDVASFELDEGVAQPSFRARWQVFLPTVAVAIIYSGAWFYLINTGRDEYALVRLVFIVMSIGVPILAAHAFLRFQTVRVQVLPNAVRYHPGWPRDVPIDMPLDLIDRVRIKRGISGHVFGGGTLVMDLTTGQKAAVADLCNPKGARDAIERRMQRDDDDSSLTGAFEF